MSGRIPQIVQCFVIAALCWSGGRSLAEETPAANAPANVPATTEEVPLNPQKTVLLDREGGKVILETEVVFRSGLLEMLVCLKRTKEHESILALDGKARDVHAGLLALGAKTGSPVNWDPEFSPPSGQEIEITLMWQDSEKKWHRTPAQKWMRGTTRKYFVTELESLPAGVNLPEESQLRFDEKHHELLWFGIMSEEQRDELLKLSEESTFQKRVKDLFEMSQIQPMTATFVFVGSGFYLDEKTGEKYYLAEDGTLICVANFPSATIDIREQSSASSGALAYEAWDERIPPLGTKVRVELKPVKKKSPKQSGSNSSK
ncbi:MAG: hypothetical protein HUJ26_02935 [Planctomycetaceae bacterium]|nr:hypothetical protein [Planctomycetaceae bacterium]